jgi:hypothetical protein
MVTTLIKNRYGKQTAPSIIVSPQTILMSGVDFSKGSTLHCHFNFQPDDKKNLTLKELNYRHYKLKNQRMKPPNVFAVGIIRTVGLGILSTGHVR